VLVDISLLEELFFRDVFQNSRGVTDVCGYINIEVKGLRSLMYFFSSLIVANVFGELSWLDI
jgi:hypothetical protein